MNLSRNLRQTAIAILLAAAFVPAHAQTAQDFEEMRAELKRLRAEIEALKKAKPAEPVAVVPPQSVPASEVVERLEQVELRAKDAVVLGDIPNSFRLPGTETSLRIYGFAELNLVHEFKADNSSCDYSLCLMYAPLRGSNLDARRDGTFLTARTSRFGFDAATPSPFGVIGIKIEGDFNNDPRTGNAAVNGSVGNIFTQQSTNSYNFRLRHAYGQFGGLLIGQTWSTFFDVDNSPETVDFNGPIGSTFIRQPMIRYSFATKDNGTFTGAIENPVSYVFDNSGSGTPTTAGFSKVPDIVGRWDKSFPWGNLSVRGVAQELLIKDRDAGLNSSAVGYGFGISGIYKVTSDDVINFAYTVGTGIGRYFNYVEGAVFDPINNTILRERVSGVVLGYQHKASPSLRYNTVIGYQRTSDNAFTRFAMNPDNKLDSTALGNFALNRSLLQAHVGLIWNPVKNVDFGGEYIYGRRRTLLGEKGDVGRIDLSAKYFFN